MKKILNTAAALLFVASSMSIGSTAQAAVTPGTLATGDTLYTLQCNSSADPLLMQVDPVTLVSTSIGTASGNNTCAAQAAYNQVDKKVYFTDWSSNPQQLKTVDLTTGAITSIGEFTLNTDNTVHPSIYAVAIDPQGHAFVTSDDRKLYSVDLATGVVTFIAEMQDSTSTTIGDVYGLTFSPAGVLYAIEYETNGRLLSINTTTGAATTVVNDYWTLVGSRKAESLAFDSNGTLFIEVDGSNSSELWSADVANFSSTLTQVMGSGTGSDVGNFLYDGSNDSVVNPTAYYQESQFIVPGAGPSTEPTLAATGVDGAVSATTGAIAFAMVAAGSLIVARRKATK